MASLDTDFGEESEEEEEDDGKRHATSAVNSTAKAMEERERIRNEQMYSFANSTLFTIVFSTPSAPDDVKQLERNCSTLTEFQDVFRATRSKA